VGIEENKAVVRRFIENVATGRDVDVADDVLAPGYVNVAMEGTRVLYRRGTHDLRNVPSVVGVA
jgi:hypothetical protein